MTFLFFPLVLPDVLKLQRQFIQEQFAKVKVDSTKVRKPYQRTDSSGAHPYSKAMQVPQVCHLCGKTYASGGKSTKRSEFSTFFQ